MLARRRARRRQRHAGRAGAAPAAAVVGRRGRGAAPRARRRAGRGRRSRGRRGGCAPASSSARSSCVEPLGEGRWLVRLEGEPGGEAPLPPYIHEPLADPSATRRCTRDDAGSAAAPTAGLHFTPELLARARSARVTLHVGLDTFRPVTAARSRSTSSTASGTRSSAGRVGADRGGASGCSRSGRRRCACSRRSRAAGELAGRTTLFVTPGFEFRRVDALLTNFHLPRSTLLALVMAFAGVEETRELYRAAIAERYRFYSFGDAMLSCDGRACSVRSHARVPRARFRRTQREEARGGPGRAIRRAA